MNKNDFINLPREANNPFHLVTQVSKDNVEVVPIKIVENTITEGEPQNIPKNATFEFICTYNDENYFCTQLDTYNTVFMYLFFVCT